jgi:hypothetical protein
MSSDYFLADALGHTHGLHDLVEKEEIDPIKRLRAVLDVYGLTSTPARCPRAYCLGYCLGARLDDETTDEWLERLDKEHGGRYQR